ncbi:MAG: AAA family ATPase, partial [Planctomycetales bacterium]|nr:AAA family ATPase [Planctomycetales bacterium]
FKKPSHTLKNVVGFAKLKKFLREELIPRFKARGEKSLAGAAVAGPIGCGKTFVFEAVAAEIDVPVLVLKSIRSQWFGQTDVIFERLRRVLDALEKVVIFVDEADTQFGQIGANAHETERRLTGKIQAMMSDTRLRGRVLWLLMTARIHLLSPDIRRPGRVGDLIIPVLDPHGADRREFIEWMLKPVELVAAKPAAEPSAPDSAADAAPSGEPTDELAIRAALVDRLDRETLPKEYSAAAFASLRSQLLAVEPKSTEEVLATVHEQLPPAIGKTREYQTLQALLNCTRRSLLPNPEVTESTRAEWERKIRQLEEEGIS